VHFEERWHWATFNFADTFISAGLVLLFVDLVRPARRTVDERRSID
jgi:lipoprotein signal peptidase